MLIDEVGCEGKVNVFMLTLIFNFNVGNLSVFTMSGQLFHTVSRFHVNIHAYNKI